MRVLVGSRQEGKTTQAFAWVSHGVQCDGYPGWSRVLVLPTMQMFEQCRDEYYLRLEDYDHRVYPLREWTHAHHITPSTEVCIDELNIALWDIGKGRFGGTITAITMTGQPWEPLDFKDRRPALDLTW